MDRAEYLKSVNDFMYQGEVFGEAIFNCYVHLEKDPERLYKLGTILQLESETKARLRPFMTRLGLSIEQSDVNPQVLASLAENYAAKTWSQVMEEMLGTVSFYLDKFRAIADASPQDEREVTQSMVVHESAIKKFVDLELAGDGANSLNDVIAQLKYPLTRPA